MSKDLELKKTLEPKDKADLCDNVFSEAVPEVEVEIENVPNHIEEDAVNKAEMAIEKLNRELEDADNEEFAEPIIGYLISRCNDDVGLAEDICQEHKTWDKCFGYIYNQAKKLSKGARQYAVKDDVVFEWAEDYYRKDDTVEVETAKAKLDSNEGKSKKKKAKSVNMPEVENRTATVDVGENDNKHVDEKPRHKPKNTKGKKDLEGQVSLFDML